MFCLKCGKENPEAALLCSSCNAVLTITTAPAALPIKTSGLAITSLVLGILTPFTCLLTFLPAIICGIIALVKINKSRGQLKGNGLAIAGIAVPIAVLPLVAIIMAIAFPAFNKARIAEHVKNRIVKDSNSSLYGIVFTTALTSDKLPKNDLQEISLKEKRFFIFMKWFFSLEEHCYTVKIFDDAGKLIYQKEYCFKPTEPIWHTWPEYELNRYVDKPGRWKVEIFLDGKKAGEKFLTVLPANLA
jgi:hypothetical protein